MRIKGEWQIKELTDILSKVPETEHVKFEIETKSGLNPLNVLTSPGISLYERNKNYLESVRTICISQKTSCGNCPYFDENGCNKIADIYQNEVPEDWDDYAIELIANVYSNEGKFFKDATRG